MARNVPAAAPSGSTGELDEEEHACTSWPSEAATPASQRRCGPASSTRAAEVTVVVADAYPNFSICGIPYYVSGEVTHWHNLAHRTVADLEATGMRLAWTPGPAHRRRRPPGCSWPPRQRGAAPLRPPGRRDRCPPRAPADRGPRGAGALGPADGVHLLHSMGDTFAADPHSLDELAPDSALIVGAGYVGLEMAEALVAPRPRGLSDRDASRGPPDGRRRARRTRPRRARRPRRRGVRPLPCGIGSASRPRGRLVVEGATRGDTYPHRRPRSRRRGRPPRHRAARRRGGQDRCQGAPSSSTSRCGPTWRTCSPPATA